MPIVVDVRVSGRCKQLGGRLSYFGRIIDAKSDAGLELVDVIGIKVLVIGHVGCSCLEQ